MDTDVHLIKSFSSDGIRKMIIVKKILRFLN